MSETGLLGSSSASPASLWERGQRAERARDAEGALAAYTQIASIKLDLGEALPAYLLDRMAAVCLDLGDFKPAALVLDIAREQMEELGDTYGVFRMTLRLAQAALAATDLAQAERHLREALGSSFEVARAGRLLERVERLSWAGREASEVAMGRVEAGLTAARFWAASGRFEAAVAATELALRVLPGAEAFFSRSSMTLLLAEHHLDCGDLAKARAVEERSRPVQANDTSSEQDEVRWRLFGARRACLEGRLSEARAALDDAERGGRGPLTRLDLQAVWMLASLLGQMNRIQDAQRLIDRAAARCDPAGAGARWRRELGELRDLLARKRESASRAAALPFVPEQVFEDAPSATLNRPRESAALSRTHERFADAWSALVNSTLSALDAGRGELAAERLDALQALAASTDSARIRARTRYVGALLDHHRGEHGRAHAALVKCVESARAQGLAMDELQYLDLLAATSAALGSWPEYRRWSEAAKLHFSALAAALDDEDRVHWELNKWSQQDRYLLARVASVGDRGRSAFPIAHVARWLDERRRRSATLRCYREMGQLVGWSIERRLSSAPAGERARALPRPEDASSSDQIEAWVRAQIELVQRTPGDKARRSFAERSFPLARIPRGVAVLQYYAVADRLFVFLVQRGDIRVWTLPVTRIELHEAVRDTVGAIVNQVQLGTNDVEPALRRLAADVGLSRLLGAIHASVEHLVLVPNDALVHAPFAALPTGAGDERLCERFVLSYAPNPRWVDVNAAARSAPPAPRSFLGVAVRDAPGAQLGQLECASEEVRAVAESMPLGVTSVTLEDSAARPAAILDALEEAEWAHFACHGLFDRAEPHRSRLLVGGDGSAAGEVSLADIQLRSLGRLRMAVLAACWTASTAVLPGTELVCLPAAFLRAGAKAVMAPLWQVDDTVSLAFMKDFYAAAVRASTPRALADLQRSWLRSGDEERSLAFHWAAYQHHGQG